VINQTDVKLWGRAPYIHGKIWHLACTSVDVVLTSHHRTHVYSGVLDLITRARHLTGKKVATSSVCQGVNTVTASCTGRPAGKRPLIACHFDGHHCRPADLVPVIELGVDELCQSDQHRGGKKAVMPMSEHPS